MLLELDADIKMTTFTLFMHRIEEKCQILAFHLQNAQMQDSAKWRDHNHDPLAGTMTMGCLVAWSPQDKMEKIQEKIELMEDKMEKILAMEGKVDTTGVKVSWLI